MGGWGMRDDLDKGTSMCSSVGGKRADTSGELKILQFEGYLFVEGGGQ